jgi:4-amino-4-deoxychorismate lyase
MCRLIETIRVNQGKFVDLNYHQKRLSRSRKDLFSRDDEIKLSEIIQIPENPGRGVYKCRVIYAGEIISVEFIPYQYRKIGSLKPVVSNSITYPYKYEDRKELASLFDRRGDCDDILIAKNNRITDTSFSNIIFFTGEKWVTPGEPLLRGTKRAKLLEQGHIIEDEIAIKDLPNFKNAALINAMLDWDNKILVNIGNIR